MRNLLRDLTIDHSDQAWADDITYIPLTIGFGYLFAIIDWHSRYVVAWELSNLLDTDFCMEALDRGLSKKEPEIFNTDQGVQFTSRQFTERLWRSVKYEDIYPKGYENLNEVRQGLRMYFEFYNEKRPHQGLEYRTPAEVYFEK